MTVVAPDLGEEPLSQCMADCDCWDANAPSILVAEGLALYQERMGRFQREAQVVASFNHPNITTLHSLEESGDAQALVTELVDESASRRSICILQNWHQEFVVR